MNPGGAAGAFAKLVDELVDVQLFEAQDDPGEQEEVWSDIRPQGHSDVGAEHVVDLVPESPGAGAFEDEVQVGGLANEVLGVSSAAYAPIHGARPKAARHVQGKANPLARRFEGPGDKSLQVRDDFRRRIHLVFVERWDTFRGLGAEELSQSEVCRQLPRKI